MCVKRHISLLLVLALLLGSSVTSLELRADVLPKYLESKVDVEIIKTDIIADGVKNTEGYASLRRDNQVDKSNMDERDWVIKKDSYALVNSEGEFIFDYDKFFCDFYLKKGNFLNIKLPFTGNLRDDEVLYKLYNFEGKLVSDVEFSMISVYYNGYFARIINENGNMKKAIIDSNGNVVLNLPQVSIIPIGSRLPEYKNFIMSTGGMVYGFGGVNEGLMWFYGRKFIKHHISEFDNKDEKQSDFAKVGNNICGYCDMKGNVVIPQQFSHVYNFSEGIAAVAKKDVKTNKQLFGYIDKKGETVINFTFDWAEPFIEGYAIVTKDGKKGYINKKGVLTVPAIYDQAIGHGNGLCSVGVKSGKKQDRFGNDTDAFKYGFCDTQGNMVVPMEFDDVSIFENGVAYAIKDRTLYILKAHERPEYVYDEADKGESLVLPTDELANVTDKATAAEAVTKAIAGATEEQKTSATGTDLLTLYGEEAALRTAKTEVEGSEFIIDKAGVEKIENAAIEAKSAVEGALKDGGVTVQRELSSGVVYEVKEGDKLSVKVDPSSAEAKADNVRVETPTYSLSFNKKALASIKEESTEPLEITITELPAENAALPRLMGTQLSSKAVGANLLEDAASKIFHIKFSKKIKEKIKLSLPVIKGNPNYQAVYDSTGKAIGGKYNPVTKKLDVKINKSDKYVVKEKKKSFADITSKSKEMQDAIEILASKGIIAGTSPTNFSPDGTITRAEIAALILRSISKLNPSENGGFSDVASTDWYFGAVGSAKRNGIMNGVSKTVFAPKKSILKDQIVAVAARVLKEEMGYLAPAGPEAFLGSYTDAAAIPNWAKSDVALATREGLVVKRYDSAFIPAGTMTRGDVAVILHRLLKKLW